METLTPKQIEDAKKSTTDYLAASIGMGNHDQVENCRVVLAALNAYDKLAEVRETCASTIKLYESRGYKSQVAIDEGQEWEEGQAQYARDLLMILDGGSTEA